MLWLNRSVTNRFFLLVCLFLRIESVFIQYDLSKWVLFDMPQNLTTNSSILKKKCSNISISISL